jgi:hypothetical protein
VAKFEGKKPLGRHKRRRGDVKMHLTETGRDSVNWINLDLDKDKRLAVVNMVMNLRVS